MNRAVFLDRDGTINVETDRMRGIRDFHLIPGASQAIRLLNRRGFAVVVVTNQAGVARGHYTLQDVSALHSHMRALLARQPAHIDAVYVCPHLPEQGCLCRKPGRLLFEQAARELDICLPASFTVGDRLTDLIPAREMGMRTVLVLTGHGRDELARARAQGFRPDCIAADLREAAQWIIRSTARAAGTRDTGRVRQAGERPLPPDCAPLQ